MISVKTPHEIECMAHACRISAEALRLAGHKLPVKCKFVKKEADDNQEVNEDESN